MTIPVVVMLISLVLWLAFAKPRPDNPWIFAWAADVCRLMFFASIFWVLYGMINKVVI